MAESAMEMAGVSWWQLYVGAGGVILLIITVALTYRATNAAIAANKIARDTAKQELRAYVHIEGAEFSGPQNSGDFSLVIMIKNFGQTPAYNVVTKAKIELFPEKHNRLLKIRKKDKAFPSISISPGAYTSQTIPFPININDWRAYGQIGRKAYLWGRIDYIDAFHEKRFVEFQMVHHFGAIAQFAFCNVGNKTEFDTESHTEKQGRRSLTHPSPSSVKGNERA